MAKIELMWMMGAKVSIPGFRNIGHNLISCLLKYQLFAVILPPSALDELGKFVILTYIHT